MLNTHLGRLHLFNAVSSFLINTNAADNYFTRSATNATSNQNAPEWMLLEVTAYRQLEDPFDGL